MCIKSRIVHWKATGLINVIVTQALAVGLLAAIRFSQPFRVQQALVLAAVGLMVGGTLYALYLSPQARDVRREIVARNLKKSSRW